MAKWQRTLNLVPEWDGVRDGTITIQEMASIISKRLLAMRPLGDPDGLDFQREDLAEQFEGLAADTGADADDFDCILSELYDWADTKISGGVSDAKRVCWVKTS